MSFKSSLIFLSVIFLFLPAAPSSPAADKPGKLLILFDQSASMHDNDPKPISKLWLSAFIKASKKPYDVTVAGFDDRIHEHLRLITDKSKDVEAVAIEVEKVGTSGLTTDQEAPLRYLLEIDEVETVSFAVIVSDGDPEIWDQKSFYLSKKIRRDPRYEELNKQYRLLRSQGYSRQGRYKRLHSKYHTKNMALIQERLAILKERFGNRLVFLDVSGEFDFFKNWAEAADAVYIAVPASGDISPVDRLGMTITALLKKASKAAQEPLPADSDMAVEPVAEAEPVSSDKELVTTEIGVIETPVIITETAETAEPIEAEPLQEKQKQAALKEKVELAQKEKPRSRGNRWVVILFTIILAAALIFIYFRPGKKTKPESTRKKMVVPTASEISKIVEPVAPVKPSVTIPPKKKGSDMDVIRKILARLAKTSLVEANSYIDTEINKAMAAVDKARLEKLKFEFNLGGSEKRIALRIPVPPGAMQVYWRDKNGERRDGAAVNISMQGVVFKAYGINAKSIDTIKCPGLDVEFHLTSSRIETREEGLAVAILDRFEDNINTRMVWVEVLTRIEEG